MRLYQVVRVTVTAPDGEGVTVPGGEGVSAPGGKGVSAPGGEGVSTSSGEDVSAPAVGEVVTVPGITEYLQQYLQVHHLVLSTTPRVSFSILLVTQNNPLPPFFL